MNGMPPAKALKIVVVEDVESERIAMVRDIERITSSLDLAVPVDIKVEHTGDALMLAWKINKGRLHPEGHLFVADVYMREEQKSNPSFQHGAFAIYNALKVLKKAKPTLATRMLMVTARLEDLAGIDAYENILSEQLIQRGNRWCFPMSKPTSLSRASQRAAEDATWVAYLEKAIRGFGDNGWLGPMLALQNMPLLQGDMGRRLRGSLDAATNSNQFPGMVVLSGTDPVSVEAMGNSLVVLRGNPNVEEIQPDSTLELETLRLFGASGDHDIGAAESCDLIRARIAVDTPDGVIQEFLQVASRWACNEGRQVLVECSREHIDLIKAGLYAPLRVWYIEVPALADRRGDWLEIVQAAARRELSAQTQALVQNLREMTHSHIQKLEGLPFKRSGKLSSAEFKAMDFDAVPREWVIAVYGSPPFPQTTYLGKEIKELSKRNKNAVFLMTLAVAMHRKQSITGLGSNSVSEEELTCAAKEIGLAFALGRQSGDKDGLDDLISVQCLGDTAIQVRAREVHIHLRNTCCTPCLQGTVTSGVTGKKGIKREFYWFKTQQVLWESWDISNLIKFLDACQISSSASEQSAPK